MKEIGISGFGELPCLHCGKMFRLDGDIHLCNSPKNEWLNECEKVVIQLPNGDLFDLKTKEVKKNKVIKNV